MFPAQLAAMKMGVVGKPSSLIEQRVGALAPIESFGRVVSTPRITGKNDVYPDCVPTAAANAVETVIWRTLNGNPSPKVIPDEVPLDILKVFVPDLLTGMNPEDLFVWWEKNSICGKSLKSWSRIEHAEQPVRETIIRRGGAYLVVNLGVAQQNQTVWTPAQSDQPGTWGAHAVWVDSCSGAITNGTSWGLPAYIDRSYFETLGYVAAAYDLEIV